jgi:2-amino-4-hydroxy-6-hydroxymethyldihydropteridine diphosphokinase
VQQERFLNAALRLETGLSPEALLAELQRIETKVFRRKRTVARGPRPMDLDILFYDDLTMAGETLAIPHPRLHERRFVLAPLAELAPDLVHPGLGRRINDLLASLDSPERVTRI